MAGPELEVDIPIDRRQEPSEGSRARPRRTAPGDAQLRPRDRARITGTLVVPGRPRGLVLFAHGSGSSRFSPRNRLVADSLHRAGFGTLLLDLLTPEEERLDAATAHLRFDIDLLANRVIAATDWLEAEEIVSAGRLGYFGASTGAAAALIAAARRPSAVGAVV